MDTTPTILPQLEDAVQAEAETHGFDETATRWLVLLLQDDPTLPAPTARAMVARVCQLPIVALLAAMTGSTQICGVA
jgi:hypothetical protein